MEPDYISVCTDGKIYVSTDLDQALAVANVSHVYEISPVGRTPVLLATVSGTGSPYTITSGAVTLTGGQHKIRK